VIKDLAVDSEDAGAMILNSIQKKHKIPLLRQNEAVTNEILAKGGLGDFASDLFLYS